MGGNDVLYVLFPLKALMCSQRQLKEAEEENSKLQLQVKELIEEYRTRLVCYLQDIAVSNGTHKAGLIVRRGSIDKTSALCNPGLHRWA